MEVAEKLAPMTSVPAAAGVTDTVQAEDPATVGERTQLEAESPEPVRATVPVGLDGVPLPCVSVTVAVTDVDWPRTIGLDPKVIEVWVARADTARLKVCVAFCGVPAVESVTCSVNEKLPDAVGDPEMTPPAEIVRPAGSVYPGATAHVSGALPPAA